MNRVGKRNQDAVLNAIRQGNRPIDEISQEVNLVPASVRDIAHQLWHAGILDRRREGGELVYHIRNEPLPRGSREHALSDNHKKIVEFCRTRERPRYELDAFLVSLGTKSSSSPAILSWLARSGYLSESPVGTWRAVEKDVHLSPTPSSSPSNGVHKNENLREEDWLKAEEERIVQRKAEIQRQMGILSRRKEVREQRDELAQMERELERAQAEDAAGQQESMTVRQEHMWKTQ